MYRIILGLVAAVLSIVSASAQKPTFQSVLLNGVLPTVTTGTAGFGASSSTGLNLQGFGSGSDMAFLNKNGTAALSLATGTGNWTGSSTGVWGLYHLDLSDAVNGQTNLDGTTPVLRVNSNAAYSTSAAGQVFVGEALTGSITTGGSANFNRLIVDSDNVNASAFGGATAWNFGDVITQAVASGGRTALGTVMNVAHRTGNGSGTSYYVALGAGTISYVQDNGTAAAPHGSMFVANFIGKLNGASFTASISGTTMTVTSVASGTILPTAGLQCSGCTAGNTVTAQTSGAAGGTGTYTIFTSEGTIASESMTSGATHWSRLTTQENDVSCQIGCSVVYKSALNIVLGSDDVVAGSGGGGDWAVGFSNQWPNLSAVGWPTLLAIGNPNGSFPGATNGTGRIMDIRPIAAAIGYGSTNAKSADGLNLDRLYTTRYTFDGAGFGAGGDGTLHVGAGTIAGASGVLQIGGANYMQTASAPSVVNAGSATGDGNNNYFAGEIVTDDGDTNELIAGLYQVTHTKAIAATVKTAGTGGTTSGSCTVVGTTGTGTKFQATVAVSGGGITSVSSISTAGDYTVNPTDPTNEPVTNGTCVGLTGSALNVGMGVLTLATLNATHGGSVWSASCSGTQTLSEVEGSGGGLTATLACTQQTQVQIGSGLNTLIGSGSALANSATVGLAMFPTTAGTPTGTVGAAGQAAFIIDTTNKKLCYSIGGGTWECTGALTP